MADDLDKLSTPEAREAFYKTETEELVKAHARQGHAFRACAFTSSSVSVL